eukprot:Sspe_Gene.8110::Locus_2763_Transcript_1_1_Confidence_1.000_Length_1398::g.8110::m.8110/K06965/PELO, DOM34, pelA; protein pelota
MRLLDRKLEKDGSGFVKVRPEDDEDLWHLYNLVLVGDTIRTVTFRKVQKEGATGSVQSSKMKLKLTIKVTSIEFDPQIGELRYSGKNISENDFVKMGAYHTSAVMVHHDLTIGKECWDAVAIQCLTQACDNSLRADLAVVVMQEGLAHVCLVTPSMTILKQKIDMAIPRKRRAGATQHDKTLLRFYEQVLDSIRRVVKWDIVKCLLVCSPGFVREDFHKYAMAEAVKHEKYKEVLQNKSKWVLAPCSSGHMHCIKEVLADKALQGKLSDTKAAGEARALEIFYDKLAMDEEKVAYGQKQVFMAAEKQAIEVLMVLDSVFRNENPAQRKKWVDLVETVREFNGDVKIFSSMHTTGQQLSNLSGCAAILRFPCPELNELDSEEEAEETTEPAGSGSFAADAGDDPFM